MDKKEIKEVLVASTMYNIGSIFGPLLVFGGLGFVLDKMFSTSPWCLLGGVSVAFLITNILLFRKLGRINRLIDSYKSIPAAEKISDKQE